RELQEKNIFNNDTLARLKPGKNGIAYILRSQDGKLTLTWFNKKSIDIYETSSHKLLHQVLLDSNQAQLITAEFLTDNKLAVFNDVNNSVSFYELKDLVLKPYARFVNAQGYEFG